MDRVLTLVFVALFTGGVAKAEDAVAEPPANAVQAASPHDVAWGGVYERSGKTVRAGEWMGIAGGGMMVVGLGSVIVGGVNTVTGSVGSVFGSEEGGERASQGAATATFGLVLGTAGFVSFQVGPSLMAGGTVRQAKAVRQVNPSAPRPWLGYGSWVSWGLGLTPSAGSFILQPTAYVLAGLQKGRNKLHWDQRSAAQYQQNLKKVQVNLTPITIDGNRGLALVGSF